MLDRLVERMHLGERKAEEKVTFDQLLVHVQRTSTILARRLKLLHLDVAKCSIREVSRIVGIFDLRRNQLTRKS